MSDDAFLYAQRDGYEPAPDRIMGRQVAGRGFFSAALRSPQASVPRFLVPHMSEISALQNFSDTLGPRGRALAIATDMSDARVQAAGAVSYFDVSKFVEACWQRRTRGLHLSLLGLTHSISDVWSRDLVGSLARVPTRDHDALVCTSRAIRSAALAMIEGEADELARRFNGRRPTQLPQMPIIPLGIDLPEINELLEAQFRRDHRARLGIGADEVVALFFGRISFHAKAHPVPMYVGLNEAALASGKKVHLIQAGWFPNDDIERAFMQTAYALAPNVSHHFLDGRDPALRRELWFAADFFTSLSDTMEESFGITPIEAMASGLPVVVSDWDGYRDTVTQGVHGFLVPTIMPPPNIGAGRDIAQMLMDGGLDFDSYEGFAGQATAVDVGQATLAYENLMTNASLRRDMGHAARRHAYAGFGWPTILEQHRSLWAELAARRALASPDPLAPHPLHEDPFKLFAAHATASFEPKTQLQARNVTRAYLDAIAGQHMNVFGKDFIAPNPVTIRILNLFESRANWTVAEILTQIPQANQAVIHRSLGWLTKMGIIAGAI
jgi:glycosyltransferase involved in cell wall biosynthesis